MSHQSDSSPDQSPGALRRKCERKTNGAVNIKCFTAGSSEMIGGIESTRIGTIDIMFAGTGGYSTFYDKTKIFDLPFLFDNSQEASEVVNGPVEKRFSQIWNNSAWCIFRPAITDAPYQHKQNPRAYRGRCQRAESPRPRNQYLC